MKITADDLRDILAEFVEMQFEYFKEADEPRDLDCWIEDYVNQLEIEGLFVSEDD